MLQHLPGLRLWARSNRKFLVRAVRYLTGTAGLEQFLDIGAGLPSANNTHQVAPDARVLYVDNDPLTVAHGRRLVGKNAKYIDGDLNEPDRILREAATTLDFSKPVGVLLVSVVDFLTDNRAARAAVTALVAGLPAGSYVALTHPTLEVSGEAVARAMELWNSSGSPPICARTPSEVGAFFHGLDLLDPGVVAVTHWRPDSQDTRPVPEYAGVARKANG